MFIYNRKQMNIFSLQGMQACICDSDDKTFAQDNYDDRITKV